ncbi:MAG: ABC transporter permease [Acetatifactor sp.]
MNKRDYTGWKDVFRFSLEQGVKAQAYKVSLVIFSLLVLFGVPFMGWLQNKGEKQLGATGVEKLMIYDETGLGIDYSGFADGERYGALVIDSAPEKSFEDSSKGLEEAEKPAEALLKIRLEESGYFQLTFVKSAKAGFAEDDYDALTADFGTFFEEAKREAIDVTPEQAAFINQPVSSGVEFATVDENGNLTIDAKDKTEGITSEEYSILLTCIIVVMMIINLAGGQIANGIVTEKSTRVVEYLMINIRPMALIVGKILAALLMVVIQLGAIGVAFVLGKLINNNLFGAGTAQAAEESGSFALFVEMLSKITPVSLVICLVVILLGVLFFSIVAGLAGASVSKLDELAEGMKIYQLLLIVGCYVGIGVCIVEMMGGVNPLILEVLCMIPISAPFILPANVLLGKIGIWVGLVSILLLFLVTVLLFSFTAKVYESMIFYNGKVLKLKDILQIAKNRRVEKKEEK